MRRLSLVVLVLSLAGAACSSEPPLTAAVYFPAVEDELMRLDQATRDLTDRYAIELEAELEALVTASDLNDPVVADRVLGEIVSVARAKMQTIIEAHTGQVAVFVARVEELAPPDTVAGRHGELIDAFTGWATSAGATVAQLEQAIALEDLAVALTDSPYADAQLRVDQACLALGDNAAAVAVVLTCPGTRIAAFDVAP